MLEKLKEYKEFIAIIIFFLGGFLWVEESFPKKADLKSEIGVLECLLNKYMTLTQLQLNGQELEKQIQELTNQVNTYPAHSKLSISPAIQHELEDKKLDLSNNKTEFRENKKKIENILRELERSECGKVIK